jgi:hypothetical protein
MPVLVFSRSSLQKVAVMGRTTIELKRDAFRCRGRSITHQQQRRGPIFSFSLTTTVSAACDSHCMPHARKISSQKRRLKTFIAIGNQSLFAAGRVSRVQCFAARPRGSEEMSARCSRRYRDQPNGRMLAPTESAIWSLEIMPITLAGRGRHPSLMTMAMSAPRRVMR